MNVSSDNCKTHFFLVSCLVTVFSSVIFPCSISNDLYTIELGFPFRYITFYESSFDIVLQSKILVSGVSINIFLFFVNTLIVFLIIKTIHKFISK